ncbi:MAG: ABC transporter substrate-binding protein/permease [Synergistaceae bacterium]|jgi:polar amino acid transport system substrate-binding protein|nr:ABC transporter substrate-binding protein/permease [Synergistaceae bacterium]
MGPLNSEKPASRSWISALLCALVLQACAASFAYAAAEDGYNVLRWGGDSEGGFPFMFPNPKNHDELIGFEVDIVDELARHLGKKTVYVNNAWDNLIPGLTRGLYDMAINGLEVTPEHEEAVNFSIPYYKTFLQLAVRKENNDISDLESCRGKIVGTLKESYAQMVLEELGDVEIRTYIVEANTYEDLQNGRIDAALFDSPIAIYSAGFNPEIKFVGPPIGEITYAIAVTKENGALLRDINEALVQLRDSGKLREIYDRWNLWSPLMAAEFNDYSPRAVEMTRYNEWAEAHRPEITLSARLKRYAGFLPDFARAAVITMEVSITAMLIAILLGLALAITRVFAPKWAALSAAAFVEFMRGTPVLIQLFFIFYGLPNVGIKLSPFWAGAVGLGLNYAAYEAEIYRAGLFAIPSTQWEAALALGMTRLQAMREVILPQAMRVVIPPITNDFISLLKDSSLVSIITMVDLTKAYGQLAATYYDYFGPGIMVAFIYLLIGLPFVKFSRYAERRLAEQDKGGKRGHDNNFYRMSARWR